MLNIKLVSGNFCSFFFFLSISVISLESTRAVLGLQIRETFSNTLTFIQKVFRQFSFKTCSIPIPNYLTVSFRISFNSPVGVGCRIHRLHLCGTIWVIRFYGRRCGWVPVSFLSLFWCETHTKCLRARSPTIPEEEEGMEGPRAE